MARLAIPLASLGLLGSLALGATYSSSSAPIALAPAPSTTSGPPLAPIGTVDVGSTGADGAFNPTGATYVVDLATQGFYDAQRWMVIFNYTSVNIPAGTTVTFTNHPSRAPVVWLVQGDVTIAGTVSLDGQAGRNSSVAPNYAESGPGGFRGGRGTLLGTVDDSSAGFGVGAGFRATGTSGGGAGGSFGTLGEPGSGGALLGPMYGDTGLAQLVGGSGGAGGRWVANTGIAGGGGGGGAILIAANGTIVVTQTGRLTANGGQGGSGVNGGAGDDGGGGSGGAIRLVADTVTIARGAPGAVVAASGGFGPDVGGSGGSGRIRIEKNTPGGLFVATIPPATVIEGGVTGANVIPNVPTFPSLSVLSVAGIAAPLDPRAPLGSGASFPDVNLALGGAQTVELEGRNIPLAATIYLRATNANGQATELAVNTTPVGSDTYWTRTVTVTFPSGYTALQARAVLP